MNIDHLHTIFANYIRKFDIINNREHGENYKWRVAAQFPSLMNPDSPDFVAGLKEVSKLNLFSNKSYHPLSGLIQCVESDEKAVRSLFRALFADDGNSLTLRQRKIDAFITNANALTSKHYSDNAIFQNDLRSAMGFLFFHDPERHYLYKAKQAKKFAEIVEFPDNWGRITDFKMDVYYRMCDELVEEIKKCDLLLRTTRRRYYDASGNKIEGMHPDENYHILAFDIIWGTGLVSLSDYNFSNGIPWMASNDAATRSDNAEVTPP